MNTDDLLWAILALGLGFVLLVLLVALQFGYAWSIGQAVKDFLELVPGGPFGRQ